MINKEKNNNNIYMTQQELAERWRVSESSLTSWRGRGVLPYFRVPGSSRILYPKDEIEKIEKANIHKKEVRTNRKVSDSKGEKHVISAGSNKNWRI